MPPTNDEVTTGQIRRGYWVAIHQEDIRRSVIYTLIAVTVVIYLILLYFLLIFLLRMGQARTIEQTIGQQNIIFEAVPAPQDIRVANVTGVRRDEEYVDVTAEIQNPNAQWAASAVDYELRIGGNVVREGTLTMAPGQERHVSQTRIRLGGGTAPRAEFEVTGTRWQRIPDTAKLPQVDWTVDGAFLRDIQTAEEEQTFSSELQFSLKNGSVYGFREVEVTVQMNDAANTTVAIGSLLLNEVAAGSTEIITFRWPQQLARTLQPAISVDVDTLNDTRIIRALGSRE